MTFSKTKRVFGRNISSFHRCSALKTPGGERPGFCLYFSPVFSDFCPEPGKIMCLAFSNKLYSRRLVKSHGPVRFQLHWSLWRQIQVVYIYFLDRLENKYQNLLILMKGILMYATMFPSDQSLCLFLTSKRLFWWTISWLPCAVRWWLFHMMVYDLYWKVFWQRDNSLSGRPPLAPLHSWHLSWQR